MTKIALFAIMLLLIVTTLLTAAPNEDISVLGSRISTEFSGKPHPTVGRKRTRCTHTAGNR